VRTKGRPVFQSISSVAPPVLKASPSAPSTVPTIDIRIGRLVMKTCRCLIVWILRTCLRPQLGCDFHLRMRLIPLSLTTWQPTMPGLGNVPSGSRIPYVDPRLFQLWLSTIQQTGYERPLPEDNYLSYAYYPGQQLPSNSHGQSSSSLVYAIPGLLNTSTPNDPVFPPPDTHSQIIVTPNTTLSGQRMPEDADVTHAPDRGLPAVDTS
jgi:hypothetical protein